MHVLLTLSHYDISDELKPSNVGLEQEAQLSRGWNVLKNGGNRRKRGNSNHQYPPAIKYFHLHECDKFSVSNPSVAFYNFSCTYEFELFRRSLLGRRFSTSFFGERVYYNLISFTNIYAWCILVLCCR